MASVWQRRRAVWLLAGLLSITACGTVYDLEHQSSCLNCPPVYVGVVADFKLTQERLSDPDWSPGERAAWLVWLPVDLVLSAIGDTVTLVRNRPYPECWSHLFPHPLLVPASDSAAEVFISSSHSKYSHHGIDGIATLGVVCLDGEVLASLGDASYAHVFLKPGRYVVGGVWSERNHEVSSDGVQFSYSTSVDTEVQFEAGHVYVLGVSLFRGHDRPLEDVDLGARPLGDWGRFQIENMERWQTHATWAGAEDLQRWVGIRCPSTDGPR